MRGKRKEQRGVDEISARLCGFIYGHNISPVKFSLKSILVILQNYVKDPFFFLTAMEHMLSKFKKLQLSPGVFPVLSVKDQIQKIRDSFFTGKT